MILYHGTNCVFDCIELDKCKPFKDFGRGFYLTEFKEQALQMARRTSSRFDGKPVVIRFAFDEVHLKGQSLSYKTFNEPDLDWAIFVINNRNENFAEIETPLCNTDNKYDIVTGPVANDDLRLSLMLFIDGRLTPDALVEQLRYKKLTQQISFHTRRAVDLLQKTGEIYG
jgi:hypothetical protein